MKKFKYIKTKTNSNDLNILGCLHTKELHVQKHKKHAQEM